MGGSLVFIACGLLWMAILFIVFSIFYSGPSFSTNLVLMEYLVRHAELAFLLLIVLRGQDLFLMNSLFDYPH